MTPRCAPGGMGGNGGIGATGAIDGTGATGGSAPTCGIGSLMAVLLLGFKE